MGPKTAAEIIAMARDEQCGVQQLAEAFLHYMPGSDGSYAELLSTLVLLRPTFFDEIGVPLEHLARTQDVLEALRTQLATRTTS